MNLEMKDFQREAVSDLLADLCAAKDEIRRRGKSQALTLSAPTASGKTVIIAALIERIFGGELDLSEDGASDPEPDAVFLWLSDQPELNRQSRARLLTASNRLREHHLRIVGPEFDAETFDGGNVFFLNSQKLGRDKLLTRYGDRRRWTIWETIRNTQERQPDNFYVILDEAHRGMNVSAQERAQANSIVQKFIVGSTEDDLPPMNLILGLSATPERFNGFLQGTNRTNRRHNIDPVVVRNSGLIKERIILHPRKGAPSPWTLLAEACGCFVELSEEWSGYTHANDLASVEPALVVQIEDATAGGAVSKTPLVPLLETLRAKIPQLRPEQVVHCLQTEAPLVIGDWSIRYADPPSIGAENSIRVVLFKMALTTGWDCPRAEVMISFRSGRDATYIAQLVGRMVRTPLAGRVHGNERLNEVYLFLPYYDETNLTAIIERLTRDKEAVPATDIVPSRAAATFRVRPDLTRVREVLRELPTYTVSSARRIPHIRRLVKFARLLSQDGLDPLAKETAVDRLVDTMQAHLDQRLTEDGSFRAQLLALETVTYRTIILYAGVYRVELGGERTVPITERDVETLFSRAKVILTEEVAMAYRRRRHDRDEPLRAKVECYELASEEALRRVLNEQAVNLIEELRQRYLPAPIARLKPERVAVYNQLLTDVGQQTAGILNLPEVIALDVPTDAESIDGHLYVDDDGAFRAKLTGWEHAVLDAERRRPEFITWLRNPDRKPWSLGVPYEIGGQIRSLYPDFIVVRRHNGHLIPDLLEPHRGEDSLAKAKGLLRFADRDGGKFGRIEMIRFEDAQLRRLDFKNLHVRQALRRVERTDQFASLFDTFG